jgi:peroxiredoxin
LRDRYGDIQAAGGELVAIGTGDQRYAAAFVKDTGAPFPVLVDDDGNAAHAASVRTVDWFTLLHPRTWKATRETSKRGYHVAKAGKRVRQLGATFVMAPGDVVRYARLDNDSTDHAPIDAILNALATEPA